MSDVLVIGYGNTLRSDDCLGVYAVRELRERMHRSNVEFLELPQLQPELAERLAHVDLAIFIDAATDGLSGELNYEPVFPAPKPPSISHSTDPAMLLGVAQELFGHAPQALLATVAGECFGYGTKLTPEVEASMHGLTCRIEQIIEQFLAEKSHHALSNAS